MILDELKNSQIQSPGATKIAMPARNQPAFFKNALNFITLTLECRGDASQGLTFELRDERRNGP